MDAALNILFPGGRSKAITLSYDDGTIYDRTLVRILNDSAVKATFNLNSSKLGLDGYLTPAEASVLYLGHEIASHTATHPNLAGFDSTMIIREVEEDIRILSDIAGYQVRGFSYPFGAYNTYVAEIVASLGIAYARTVHSTHTFTLPDNFLTWHPTCHHGENLPDILLDFMGPVADTPGCPALLYVWGHSYEFQDDDTWGLMRRFCLDASGDPRIWHATNIEVRDYLEDARRIRYLPENGSVLNNSLQSIWISHGTEATEVGPGESIFL